MSTLHVLPVGTVDEETLAAITEGVMRTFGMNVLRLGSMGSPEFAFDRNRLQYSSEVILRAIVSQRQDRALRVLAVTDVDLFIPMLTFVYGQAQLNGCVSLVSTSRMHQEFYGLPRNKVLTVQRAVKESLHELGHTFGLTHCPDPLCLMSIATGVGQLDAKGGKFCGNCSLLVCHMLSSFS